MKAVFYVGVVVSERGEELERGPERGEYGDALTDAEEMEFRWFWVRPRVSVLEIEAAE